MNLGILLWNKCNATCKHCAVDSSPFERFSMTDEQIFKVIDSSFYDCSSPSIGLSGGEAFLNYKRLKQIIKYATNKGARVSVNSNGFWGKSIEKAREIVRELKELELSKLVISIDEFHEEFINADLPMNVILACKQEHLEVQLQYVSVKNGKRLSDFLSRYGDSLLNIECREIPLHPVGRGAQFSREILFINTGIPTGLCPSAILSISAKGDIIPCCNTAGHLPGLRIGDINTNSLPDVDVDFRKDPLFIILCQYGPHAFIKKAIAHGYIVDDGYIDQCHLCYTLFKNEKTAKILRQSSRQILDELIYEDLLLEYVRTYEQLFT